MKKIRYDYYNYRLKKGRADILLQKAEGADEYCVPFHYVEAEKRLCLGFSWFQAEDDGDLVLVEKTLNDCHMRKSGKVWMPLNKLMNLSIYGKEPLRVRHHIFSFFLEMCPREGESGIIRRVEEMLDVVKVEIAKKEYVNRLRSVLEGQKILLAMDAYTKQPDPELIKKEIETLTHFRIHKPSHPGTNQRDGELSRMNLYSYEPINWYALGAEVRPMKLPPWAEIRPTEFPPYADWDGNEED